MKLGRNEPCHCGSGKKYKRCCLAKDQAANVIDYEWHKLRRTEGEIVYLLLHVANEWYGPEFIQEAWEEYTEGSKESLSIEEVPESETSFLSWALFNYVPRQREPDADPLEVPLARSFLLLAEELEPFKKQFVLAMCEQPVSFWSVQEVDPGTSLTIRDLFTHAEHIVKERRASEVLKKGDIVYTRVISMGQTTIMVGLAPIPFPPAFQFDILNAREILFGRRRKISYKELHGLDPVLRQLYFALRSRLLNPQLPIVQNTDGDPLKFVKLMLLDSVSESFEEKFAKMKGDVESPEQKLQREEQEAFSALPEVQALMKEMGKKQWEEWLDEPVPVLTGKTPREAAKTVAGRKRLEALLIDFERNAAETDNPGFAPDVTELRRQLRMLPGVKNQKTERKRKRSVLPVSDVLERDAVPLYQLKMTLKWSDPPIWRRVVVRSDMPLHRLHGVIQRVMGWTDSHLHQFIVGNKYYGTPDPEMMAFGFGSQILSEKRYTIADLAPAVKRSFVYEYDFGDGWEHKIVVEKILPPDPEFQHPVCLAGANNCPPEDCGGIGGYSELIEILADPRHPEHESKKEWLGYDFDPARFSLEIANDVLRRLKA
jgi:hypothetical protein